MGGRRPFHNQGRQRSGPRSFAPAPEPTPRPVRQPPPVYGPPFILLEDDRKNTFEYVGGAWVAFSRSIADCKLDCQVKQLAQKVNNMTRYEVRASIG
jgi:hypothetical protein